MKVQIDTTKKTVRMVGPVPIESLVDCLSSVMPDGAWLDYSIETAAVAGWKNPIRFTDAVPMLADGVNNIEL